MFRSWINDETWRVFETLTLLYNYEKLQKQIVNAFNPYSYVVKGYSNKCKRNVRTITHQYLRDHREVSKQNVALLKNAIELWREARRTSKAVAPVIYHYSLHCFVSFFNYTFFRWEPEHAHGHGIRISKWGNNIMDIEIEFLKQGIFQRLIDTWTLLGACLAISPFSPILEEEKIEFIPNERFLLRNSGNISLNDLLTFNSEDFEQEIKSDLHGKLINRSFLQSAPNNSIKDYLIVFIASNLARYRPYLWNSVLIGETPEESNFGVESTKALVRTTGNFLWTVDGLFRRIKKGKFEFKSAR